MNKSTGFIFCSGAAVSTLITCIIQDLLGKDAYINIVRDNWVAPHPVIYSLLIVFIVWVTFFNDKPDNKAQEKYVSDDIVSTDIILMQEKEAKGLVQLSIVELQMCESPLTEDSVRKSVEEKLPPGLNIETDMLDRIIQEEIVRMIN